MHRCSAWWIPILLATAVACEPDPGRPPQAAWRVAAAVRDHRDGSPRPGVPLLLVDVEANRPVAGPLVTGEAGTVSFDPVPAGRYAVLAFPGARHGIWHWPGSFRLPPAAPAADPPLVAILTVDRQGADGRPRISGQVVEAGTGRPLARAFVHLPGSIDAYLGAAAPQGAVTDVEGRFTVEELFFGPDPESGRIRQLVPLVIQREGFLPRTWTLPPLPADAEPDIEGVEIALEPLAGAPAGEVSGRVVYLGEPVPGLPVGLSFLGEAEASPAKARLGLPGAVARTDFEGRFRFAGIPTGIWLVHPAFADDDGFLVMSSGEGLAVTVAAGQAAHVGDLPVVRRLRPLTPAPGAAIADTLPRLAWAAITEADTYLVFLGGEAVAATAEPWWQVPPGQGLAAGAHAWGVEALAGGIVSGLTDYRPHRIRFRVAPPPPD